jgi:LDH2 family malate/lactate/ureidoglycolate dehydrogenase
MIRSGDLTQAATEILCAAGIDGESAEVVAKSLVDADLRGIHSHGVSRLGIYVERLRQRGNAAMGEPETILELPALVVLDAADLLSQIVSAKAIEIATRKAAHAGCATVLVRGGSHFGAAGYWARGMAERGFVGVASTNTSPLMAPWGGATTAIGTNPIALAFPSSSGSPVVVDLATSESTWGAIIQAKASGSSIPPTWALGTDGQPTENADQAIEARRLLPFGRHKGYALAVGIELLTGALAGAATLSKIPDMYAQPDEPMSVGHFFLAIDTMALKQAGIDFARTVAEVQRELNALAPQPGIHSVLWPGQVESERAKQRTADGIPLPAGIVRDVASTAAAVGVTVAW